MAEHADIWHSFSDPETLERKLAILDEHCAAVGRDRSEIEISTGVSVRGMGSLDPAVVERQYALGVRLFEAAASGPDYDLTTLTQLLAWRDSVEPRS